MAILCAPGACRTGAATHAARPATPVAGTLPPGPPAPTSGLGVWLAGIEWVPPSETAGDLEGLADALRSAGPGALAVRVGPRLAGVEGHARARALVTTLAGGSALQTTTGTPAAVPLTTLVRSSSGERLLPVQRIPGPADVRPLYRTDGLRLELDRAALRQLAGGAAHVLVIDDAPIDVATWNALETHYVGSCDAAMQALAAGQERSLAMSAAFLDHADAALSQVFRAQLRAYLPGLRADLGSYAGASAREGACVQAYANVVQAYGVCLGADASACEHAPRTLLTDGALLIASREPEAARALPEGCPEALGRDFLSELRSMSRESAQAVSARLSPEWVALADRLATLGEVHGALAEICVPRRRRFTPAALDELQVRLARVGELLAAPPESPAPGSWSVRDGSVPVPGIGPMHVVARYERAERSLASAIVEQIRAAREYAFGQAVCRTRREGLPLAAAVIDVERGALSFFGFFYPEELFCDGLPPLRASSSG